jgi:hypothetical protein
MIKTTYVTLKITYNSEHGSDPKEYWDTLVDTELGQYLGLDYNETLELYSVKDFPPRNEF